jgi:carbamoyltransferase
VNVLGVNCSMRDDGQFAADGNVALFADGRIAFALAEERVTRRKYDGGFEAGLRHALDRTAMSPSDIDTVAVVTFGQPTDDPLVGTRLREVVAPALGRRVEVDYVASHHEAHAYAAATQCVADRSIVAVLDNTGSMIGQRQSDVFWKNPFEMTSYFLLADGRLTLVARDHDEPGAVGYGKAYSKVTRYIGFRSYQEAGKTMGLAAFGTGQEFGDLSLFDPGEGAKTTLRNSHDGLADLAEWFSVHGQPLPRPRSPGDPIRPADVALAAWVQRELERSVVDRLRSLLARHDVRHVCVAGGVALNSVLNRRIADELPVDGVFVPPSPSDTGLAVGAIAAHLGRAGTVPRWNASPFLGGCYSDDEIGRAITRAGAGLVARRCDDVAVAAAHALQRGEVVGWFQGASEYGPRALGHRSILADPRNPWQKDVLNHQVKQREWFRPYAPAVLLDRADTYFDLGSTGNPVPFMMQVAPAREPTRQVAPACVHVDGTARLQTVSASDCSLFTRVIEQFEHASGVPMVLNTSFNLAGMPIVESPDDALRCFVDAERMDRLFIGPFDVQRS